MALSLLLCARCRGICSTAVHPTPAHPPPYHTPYSHLQRWPLFFCDAVDLEAADAVRNNCLHICDSLLAAAHAGELAGAPWPERQQKMAAAAAGRMEECLFALAAVLAGDAAMPAALATLPVLDEVLQPLAAEAGAEMLLPQLRPSSPALIAFSASALTVARILRKLYYATALALLDAGAAEAAEAQLAEATSGVGKLAAAHEAALMAAAVGAGEGVAMSALDDDDCMAEGTQQSI